MTEQRTIEIVAFDLDGTLCNIEHRLPYITQQNPKDWRAFFAACIDDKPIWPIINLAKAIGEHFTVEIWSGRSDEVRQQTSDWLIKHGLGWVETSRLRMRKAGDHRPDHQVKGEWLDALAPADRPVIAYDDRQQVVDMWRSRGIICCQVAPGDF